jgi:hypothetical protein
LTAKPALSPAKRALLERALRERREAAATTTIPRRAGGGPAPLSFAQQRMWFLQQWQADAPTFNGARAIRIRGRLDVAALERAFEVVIARHETLRTVVATDGELHQRVLDPWSFQLPLITLPGPPQAGERELPQLLRQLSREPFDLTADLMLRATLFELAPDDHVLLIRMHHIAADAHSDRVLFTELSELYGAMLAGRRPNLPELPIQYSDFAVWERDRLAGPALAPLLAYWTAALEGAPLLLALPTDLPRPSVAQHEGAHHHFTLPAALGAGVVALGRAEGATFFMTMLAAFATFLYRESGEQDIVVGSPIAARNRVELEGLVGFFTNTMALRTRLAGNPPFSEAVRRARATALGAYEHQDLPFEKVVEALRPKRDPSHNPLFVVNFRAQAAARPTLELPGARTEQIAVDIGFSRFDLALELELRDDGLAGYFEYNQALFVEETIVGLVEDLEALLVQVVADPQVPVLAIRLPHGRRRRDPAGPRSRTSSRPRAPRLPAPGEGGK